MANLLALLFFILWLPLASILTGVAFEVLWDWFIVPLGVAPISVTHAMGLSLMLNFSTNRNIDRKKEDRELPEVVLAAFAKHLATIGIVLLFGYIIKSYM